MNCDCCRDEITVANFSGDISYFRKAILEKARGHDLCRQCLTDIMNIKYSPVKGKVTSIVSKASSCATLKLTDEEWDKLYEMDDDNPDQDSPLWIKQTICDESNRLGREMRDRVTSQLTKECLNSIVIPDENLYNEIAVRRIRKRLKSIDSEKIYYRHIKTQLINRRGDMGLVGLKDEEYDFISELIDVFTKHHKTLEGLA
jgi:hypothetical protein